MQSLVSTATQNVANKIRRALWATSVLELLVCCMLLFKSIKSVARCSFNRFNVYLTARRGALLGASGDQTALPSFYLLPGQTDSKLFGTLFVAIDALMFVSFLSYFFDVVFHLFSEPLGVDFKLPN